MILKNMRKNEFIQRGLEREEQGKIGIPLFMGQWLQGERSQPTYLQVSLMMMPLVTVALVDLVLVYT